MAFFGDVMGPIILCEVGVNISQVLHNELDIHFEVLHYEWNCLKRVISFGHKEIGVEVVMSSKELVDFPGSLCGLLHELLESFDP